jgi:hypothetical protein
LLVPVIMKRHTTESGDFHLRLGAPFPACPRLRPRYQPVAERCADGLTDYYEEVIIYATDPLSSSLGDVAPRGNPNGNADGGDLVLLLQLVLGAPAAP